MRIIQSFWSKPAFGSNAAKDDNRFSGGWPSRKYHYMSWALSCLKFRDFFDEVELYTDLKGKELLIDAIGLPYTKVHIVLDSIKNYNENLWTLGKLYVYGQQKTPFIHADSDIYIWERFSQRILNAELIAQNPESNESYYRATINQLINFKIPNWLVNELNKMEVKLVSNTGIVGGRNLAFFRAYAKMAFEIFDRNLSRLDSVNVGVYSVLIEQYLFYSLASRLKLPIVYLFNELFNGYLGDVPFVKTHLVPTETKYVHPLAHFKRAFQIYNTVELALKLEFPKYYLRIVKLLEEKKI